MLGKRILLFGSSLFALGGGSLAHAQVGLYADFTAQRLGNIPASGTATTPNNSAVNPTGGTFGAFYDFKTFGPVRLGADARFSHTVDSRGAQASSVGGGTHLYSTLGGVRASFHTPIKLLVPYVQASAGLGRSDFGMQARTFSNALEYHAYAGTDFNLLPHVSWRVVELGYGGLDAMGHNYTLASVSTGVVLRFGVGGN